MKDLMKLFKRVVFRARWALVLFRMHPMWAAERYDLDDRMRVDLRGCGERYFFSEVAAKRAAAAMTDSKAVAFYGRLSAGRDEGKLCLTTDGRWVTTGNWGSVLADESGLRWFPL